MPAKRIICSLDEHGLDIIEKYKTHYKFKHGINLSRTAIIKMIVSRLSKEISIQNNNAINTI